MSAREKMPTLYRAVADVEAFSSMILTDHTLRAYQLGPARAILDSVYARRGDQFAIVFSRQAGKDEMLAQLLTYLLVRSSLSGGTAVIAAPTFRPQAALARDRLRDRLLGNPLTSSIVRRMDASTIEVGKARARFVSASPRSNARGLTADLLLVANEAQDIAPRVWDAVFDPMAASTNATTVFMGTVWNHSTLLARQMRHMRTLEAADGRQRVWMVPWQQVAHDLPAYGARVQDRIDQLGEHHPFVRTEYFLEELDGEGGLFPPRRLTQLQGSHPRLHRARPGQRYALLIDVAGEEEDGGGRVAIGPDRGRRDSTALTVVEIDTTSRADGRATYRVVDRRSWTGTRHDALHDQLVDLARTVWRASWVVVDATGIGAGLASFLAASLRRTQGGGAPIEVIPFVFSAASKSRLGWDFLGLIDSGRYKDYVSDAGQPGPLAHDTALYEAQLRATTFDVLAGPGNVLRWSVPAADGHDDLVISAALCAALDDRDLRRRIARGA